MTRIRDFKARARRALIGNYTLAICAQILASLISVCIFGLAAVSLGVSAYGGGLIGGAGKTSSIIVVIGALCFSALLMLGVVMTIFMRYGMTRLYLNICRDRYHSIADIFYPFGRGAHPWRIVGVKLIQWIITGACAFVIYAFASLGRHFASAGTFTAAAAVCTVLSCIAAVFYIYVLTGFYLADLVIIDDPESGIFGAFARSLEYMSGRRLRGLWLMVFSFIFWRILIAFCQPASLWVVPYMACTRIFFYIGAQEAQYEPEAAEYTEVPEAEEHDDGEHPSEPSGQAPEDAEEACPADLAGDPGVSVSEEESALVGEGDQAAKEAET